MKHNHFAFTDGNCFITAETRHEVAISVNSKCADLSARCLSDKRTSNQLDHYFRWLLLKIRSFFDYKKVVLTRLLFRYCNSVLLSVTVLHVDDIHFSGKVIISLQLAKRWVSSILDYQITFWWWQTCTLNIKLRVIFNAISNICAFDWSFCSWIFYCCDIHQRLTHISFSSRGACHLYMHELFLVSLAKPACIIQERARCAAIYVIAKWSCVFRTHPRSENRQASSAPRFQYETSEMEAAREPNRAVRRLCLRFAVCDFVTERWARGNAKSRSMGQARAVSSEYRTCICICTRVPRVPRFSHSHPLDVTSAGNARGGLSVAEWGE